MKQVAPAIYGIEEHRHRFGVWAAARAAQRNFTSVDILREALEDADVRGFVRNCDVDSLDQATFEARHREMCNGIMARLMKSRIENKEKITFGRAAKLLAVYLKSVVVLGERSGCALSRVAHPPIDRILLSNLAANTLSEYRKAWATERWTTLDEKRYYALIEELRTAINSGEPFWMLEQHWTIVPREIAGRERITFEEIRP